MTTNLSTKNQLATFSFEEGISTITLDDGKANVMSVQMLEEINVALDDAERQGGAVILTGREKMFSGGFDLSVFKAGDQKQTYTMLSNGARLAERLLSFPLPIITACSGHAVAMGIFLLVATDYRIGVQGGSKFAANEVAIGSKSGQLATLEGPDYSCDIFITQTPERGWPCLCI